jgi:LPS-assembly lipoprotein
MVKLRKPVSSCTSPLWGGRNAVAKRKRFGWGRRRITFAPTRKSFAFSTSPQGGGAGKIAALLFASLALCACGFHPLYGTLDGNPGAQAEFSSIYIEPVPNEISGYELRNTLISLLHASDRLAGMRYRLSVSLHERREGVAIAADVNATLTRYGYTMEAHYELTDIKTNKLVTKGTEITQEGYDVASSPYATEVTLQDTRKRAAQDVAEHLRLDLGVFFAKHP